MIGGWLVHSIRILTRRYCWAEGPVDPPQFFSGVHLQPAQDNGQADATRVNTVVS
jgi:hypothetical protein